MNTETTEGLAYYANRLGLLSNESLLDEYRHAAVRAATPVHDEDSFALAVSALDLVAAELLERMV